MNNIFKFSILFLLLIQSVSIRVRGALGRKGSPSNQISSTAADCSTLPGVWTGFFPPTKPLYDEYDLQFETGAPIGEFTAVVIRASSPNGWTIGKGQLSLDNRSVTMVFDTGLTLFGNVSEDCSAIFWNNDSVWQEDSGIDIVHLLSMSHIDVGYHIAYSASAHIIDVLQAYIDIFFPRAIAIARALRDLNGQEKLLYTSHSWLLSLYLHCPMNLTLSDKTLRCPSDAAVEELKAAIQIGDIYFHAGAFNIEYEQAIVSDVIDFSFQLAFNLADELGVPRPSVLSLRDVPGTTRALVPILVRNNISAISIGVNDAAPNANMPNPGLWVDPESNTSVLYMQTGPNICYPWPPGPDPLNPGGLGVPSCVVVQGLKHAMCWVFRVDNAGPPESVEEVINAFTISRWQFPGAQVWASTFENFTQHLATISTSLNVTTAEAGDNWVQSTTADPYKISWYREAARAYKDCVTSGVCTHENTFSDPRLFGFLRMLIKTPEHTYGTPDFYDNENWTNEAFHAIINSNEPAYIDALSTYTEQRDIVAREGMRFLADHPLAANITARISLLTPIRPNITGLIPLDPSKWGIPISVPVSSGEPNVEIGLDSVTGALSTLTIAGVSWADATHLIGAFVYKTFDDTDLATQSPYCCFGHSSRQAAANPNSTSSMTTLTNVWLDSLTSPRQFTVQMELPDITNTQYGAPNDIWATYCVTNDGSVEFTFQIFNKTATRLAEAAFLKFASPIGAGGTSFEWRMRKLESWINPLDSISGGSPHQHVVSDGIQLALTSSPDDNFFAIDSLDAAVFSPETNSSPATNFIVPFNSLQGPILGFSALLWQNAFNTNTPLFTWDKDFKWRFVFRAKQGNTRI
jgi:hypothetical protein